MSGLLRPLQYAVEYSCQILAYLVIGIYYPRSVVPLFVYMAFETILFPLLHHNITNQIFLSDHNPSESKFRTKLVLISIIKTLLIVPGCYYSVERLAEHIAFTHSWKETIDLDADYEIWSPLFDNLKCTILMCVLAALGALRKGLLIAYNQLTTQQTTKVVQTSLSESVGYLIGALGTFVLYNLVSQTWFTERVSFHNTPLYLIGFVVFVAVLELVNAIRTKSIKRDEEQKSNTSFEEAIIGQLQQDFVNGSFSSVLKNWAEVIASARIFENDALMIVFLLNMHFDTTSIGIYLGLRALTMAFNRSQNASFEFYKNASESFWMLLNSYTRYRGDTHHLVTFEKVPTFSIKVLFIIWKWIHTICIVAATISISSPEIYGQEEIVHDSHFSTFWIFFGLLAMGMVIDQLASRINLEQASIRKAKNDMSVTTRQWTPMVAQFLLILWLIFAPERIDPGLYNFKWCIDVSCVLTLVSSALFTLYALIKMK